MKGNPDQRQAFRISHYKLSSVTFLFVSGGIIRITMSRYEVSCCGNSQYIIGLLPQRHHVFQRMQFSCSPRLIHLVVNRWCDVFSWQMCHCKKCLKAGCLQVIGYIISCSAPGFLILSYEKNPYIFLTNFLRVCQHRKIKCVPICWHADVGEGVIFILHSFQTHPSGSHQNPWAASWLVITFYIGMLKLKSST